MPVGDQPEIEQDPRFARAGVVRDNLGGEPQALMERDRSGVGHGGDGLRPDGSLVAGAVQKGVVEKSPYAATSLTLPGCDEVNVGQPVSRDRAEEVAQHLLVLADNDRARSELVQPDGLVQGTHVALAPECGQLTEDLRGYARSTLR